MNLKNINRKKTFNLLTRKKDVVVTVVILSSGFSIAMSFSHVLFFLRVHKIYSLQKLLQEVVGCILKIF